MGQILGLGITHYPGLSVQGNITRRIKVCLSDPALPERLRSAANWPEPMRRQWGSDEGQAHSDAHRRDMVDGFRRARRALDEFRPDFCLIWGDDQFENWREDCVPPFAVLAYDSVEVQPWLHDTRGVNSWNEPKDKTFTIRGHRAGAKSLATALINEGFDVAYAYRPLHAPLGHAFVNSVLYLDWDRAGFPYPVVPFTVNSYGRHLTGTQGVPPTPSKGRSLAEGEEDPPGPQPWRCFQLGGAVARALAQSPWRVALIASSSWSHSFLTAKHARMYPDVESDRRFFEAFSRGDWEIWRTATIEEAEDRGHHELLNWFCLAGAMAELGRKPDEAVFLESWISNSDKVFAVFRP
ncbi:MAG TPA: extradiol ring-cleavage dioxygenase [candidate division Zixibacteria bacterium]|nr:extradiol ring-cleavage dioxygenase [candidate division Zixibacteria bacterium]